jgi:hypothetical protein
MTMLEMDRPLGSASNRTTAMTIACWGSAGSGKSTVGANIAFELAALGLRVVLVDADTYNPSLSALLGITDPGPGLTACLRLARQGRFDEGQFDRLSHYVQFEKDQLWLIPGLNSLSRWPEVAPEELAALKEVLSVSFEVIVWDVAPYLDADVLGFESGSRRNQAANHLITESDLCLALFMADPVGVNRFFYDIRNIGREVWPIANRVRTSVLGRAPRAQLAKTLRDVTKLELVGAIEEDAGFDEMLKTTRPLLLQGKSAARREVRRIASMIADRA